MSKLGVSVKGTCAAGEEDASIGDLPAVAGKRSDPIGRRDEGVASSVRVGAGVKGVKAAMSTGAPRATADTLWLGRRKHESSALPFARA